MDFQRSDPEDYGSCPSAVGAFVNDTHFRILLLEIIHQ